MKKLLNQQVSKIIYNKLPINLLAFTKMILESWFMS